MPTRREFLAASAAVAAMPPVRALPGLPRDFLWGASASAYQIEGAAAEDGKGESVWDAFVRRRGAIADGQSGATACDFYHRYPGDIAIMRGLGLRAFRFSLAWTRILPEGRGAVNRRGLDFYSRLVDALLAAGIEPVATLFHWDTPSALEARGGWRTRDMADWFAEYAAAAARALSDRVRWWLTINEPRSFVGGGYVAGVQAPGLKLERREALAVGHNVLLAHGRAVGALRAAAPRPVKIGLPNDFTPVLVDEAETFTTRLGHFAAGGWWNENAWWHDPVYRGAYPAAAAEALGADAPAVAAGDMAVIAQPLDFLAVNVYAGRRLTPLPPGYPETAFGWPVEPAALEWAPRWLHARYRLPVFVTENGCSTRDWVALDGKVHDPQRSDFLARYLQALGRAADRGVPLLGYLHWSLLDNFEWQAGYTQRFGLVHVDFTTQRRTVKDSARWYAQTIRS